MRGRMRPSREQAESSHLFDRNADWKRAVHFHAPDFSHLSVLLHRPQFLQHFVKLFLIGHGENFLVGNFAVMQFDSAIRQARVAEGDDVTWVDLETAAFNEIPTARKQLRTLPSGVSHTTLYRDRAPIDVSAGWAADWFAEHLIRAYEA